MNTMGAHGHYAILHGASGSNKQAGTGIGEEESMKEHGFF